MLSPEIIAAEYERLGHHLGWRFLTCPEKNIESAEVALVTLNPGGRDFEPPLWSVKKGCAYVNESWKGAAPGQENLQRQVRGMFRVMDVEANDVLSGYLVPFRSPNWAELGRKTESLAFGASLWREVFSRARPHTVIAMGKETADYLVQILDAVPDTKRLAGWGDQTIDGYHFGDGHRLLALPHLSRFALFGREKSESEFRAALAGAGGNLAMREAKFQRSFGRGVIRLLVRQNPKIGKSRARFDCYKDEMTEADYVATVLEQLGPSESRKCAADLKWDSDAKRRFIRIDEQ